MNKKNLVSLFPTFLIFLSHSQSVLADSNWQGKMKSLAETMDELLPELASKKGDAKLIEKGAKSLSELTHDLKEGSKSGKLMPPGDIDPSLTFLAEQFSDQARRAYRAIQIGQLDYGKTLLRSATSYCIACHTRHENGPEFSAFPLSDKVKTLGTEERAELYVATRQFDKALVDFNSLIADEELVKKRPFDWERTLRNALAIAVRVKKDPKAATKTVNEALKSPFVPEFERAKLVNWQKAIETWSKEPTIKTNTEIGHAAEMKRLYLATLDAQLNAIDHSAEVQFLRLSAAAHDVLRVGRDPKLIAEALMTAGTAYEVLANPIFWPMHEFYYEACVRQLPHSPLAQKCYSRFERSVYLGYTGTSGTNIPDDIRELLTKLRTLSKPKGKK